MESLQQAEADHAQSYQEYDKYIKVIDVLSSMDHRNTECDEKLHIYRTTVSSKFLPTLDFWKEWLTDAILSSLDVESVVERALASCPDINLVIDMLDYKISKYATDDEEDEAAVIKAFEQSITICGIDILDGGLIWKRYTDFLLSEHEALLGDIGDSCDASSALEIQESKARILSVYHRQLSLPLKGNDSTLQELDIILERICVESDVNLINPSLLHQKYNEAVVKLDARMVYENQIKKIETSLSSKSKTASNREELIMQLAHCFMTYIKFEESYNHATRCQRLYERALLLLNDSEEIWKGFTDFAFYSLKDLKLVSAVTTRALKKVKNDANLWSLHLVTSEQNNCPPDEINVLIEQALQCSFATMEDYFGIILFSCDYNRRYLETISKEPQDMQTITKAIDALRLSFTNGKMLLKTHFFGWEYAYIYICKYHSKIEDNLISNIGDTLMSCAMTGSAQFSSQSASVWKDGVACFPSSYYTWSAYIEWAILNCDRDTVSKLFKKAYSSITGNTEQLGKDWIDYERQRGTIKSLYAAMNKVNSTAITTQLSDVSNGNNTAKKRQVVAINGDNDTREQKVDAKKARMESKTEPNNDLVEIAKDFRINEVKVKNFNFKLTEKDLQDQFSNCGEVKCVEVPLSKSGNKKGYAYILFADAVGHNNALLLNNTNLGDRMITVEGTDREKADEEINYKTSTIFVSKLPADITEDEIRALFCLKGQVIAVKVICDKRSGEGKGQALVQFATTAESKAALLLHKVEIRGAVMSVLPSKFPIINPASKAVTPTIKAVSEIILDSNSVPPLKKETSIFAFKPRSMKINIDISK